MEKSVQPILQDDPEVKKSAAVFAMMTSIKTIKTPTDHLLSFFSDWMNLLKAVAWYIKVKKHSEIHHQKEKRTYLWPDNHPLKQPKDEL